MARISEPVSCLQETEELPMEITEKVPDMDDLMARTIVENLILGINPTTGRRLASGDSCSNEVVKEALRMVLSHCSLKSYGIKTYEKAQKKAEKKKKNILEESSAKKHEVWEKENYRRLAELCREGKCILEMAHELNCSTDLICEKLKSMGK